MINAHLLKVCNFDQIYQIGDSLSDTGNLIREAPIGTATPCAQLPYGETFFKYPTGRCSNGLLMIDYVAINAGVPFIPPYTDTDADFSHGVNFAVAGATALSSNVLAVNHHVFSPPTDSSLLVQSEWMSNHFNTIFNDKRDRIEKLQNALFMVGEIGANDYHHAILQGKTMKELKRMADDVIYIIMSAAREAISYGATRVVVPGLLPMGCLPIYRTAFETNITAFETNITAAYDENQCVKQLNDLAKYHNDQLQDAIFLLNLKTRPHAITVYGDYYNAYQFLLQFAKFNGFDTQRACCGIGGKYNFNMTRMCGGADVGVCADPERYVSWDGMHLTQEGYKIMAFRLVHKLFPKLQCHL